MSEYQSSLSGRHDDVGESVSSFVIAVERSTPPSTKAPQAVRDDHEFRIREHRSWWAWPDDVRRYLSYHQTGLSHHCYGIRCESGSFFRTTFLETALDDPSHTLLYAIVAFSCYHYRIQADDVGVSVDTFLEYYNKSILLLRESIARTKPGIAMLLTILQLATIEVCFSMFRPINVVS